ELYRGVTGYYYDFKNEINYSSLIKFILKFHNFKMNDTIVLTQGYPPGLSGTTNSILVLKVGQTFRRRRNKQVQNYVSENFTLSLDKDKCLTCGICEELCPVGIFDVELRYMRIIKKNLNKCLKDMLCVKSCPVNALQITENKQGKEK
ncbi:MAG TPA: hypothetical protein ENN73_02440, partial [Firmicutes bacterium]|nr:hypothetical protein [Bacillota bacterium]